VFHFVQTLLDHPNHAATVRALATEHLPWPEHNEPAPSDILDRAAQFYAGRLTGAPLLGRPRLPRGVRAPAPHRVRARRFFFA
jgi:hypothetical protein